MSDATTFPCTMEAYARALLEECDEFEIRDAVKAWLDGDWSEAVFPLDEGTIATLIKHGSIRNPESTPCLRQTIGHVYPACDCRSYNRPDRGGDTPEAILDPRPHFSFATKTVCVDACIANVIVSLWQAGIWTRGCCCGHNRQHPSVMIDNPKDCEPAAAILRNDGRDWQILVWAKKGGAA